MVSVVVENLLFSAGTTVLQVVSVAVVLLSARGAALLWTAALNCLCSVVLVWLATWCAISRCTRILACCREWGRLA